MGRGRGREKELRGRSSALLTWQTWRRRPQPRRSSRGAPTELRVRGRRPAPLQPPCLPALPPVVAEPLPPGRGHSSGATHQPRLGTGGQLTRAHAVAPWRVGPEPPAVPSRGFSSTAARARHGAPSLSWGALVNCSRSLRRFCHQGGAVRPLPAPAAPWRRLLLRGLGPLGQRCAVTPRGLPHGRHVILGLGSVSQPDRKRPQGSRRLGRCARGEAGRALGAGRGPGS